MKNSSKLYGGYCKEIPVSQIVAEVIKFKLTFWFLSPSLIRKFTQVYCQRKLWLLFLSDVQTKQLRDLRCCKSMQLEIGGLAAKNCFVHSLQKIANYFTGKSIYF